MIDHDNAQYKYLTTNYRSNESIIDMANVLITFNKNKIDKNMFCGSNEFNIKPIFKTFINE